MYDTDRSGCITKEEVASMLRVSYFPNSFYNLKSLNCFQDQMTCKMFLEQALPEDCLPADITEPGKLDEIFDKMDANSDGKVSFDESKLQCKEIVHFRT